MFERKTPLISVIIPSWFTPKQKGKYGEIETFWLATKCLKKFIKNTTIDYELIIIDNGSWIKDSKDYITQLRSEGATIVDWGRKYCPSKALNKATLVATGEFLLFLDNDTIAQRGFIEGMLECFRTEGCGASSLRLVQPKTGQFTTGMDYDYRLGFGPSMTGEGIVEKGAISGSCMMIPTTLFREVGGFDEGYSFLWQDVDICCKLRSKGYASMCNTKVHIFHIGGVTRRYLSKSAHTIDYMHLIRTWWGKYLPRNLDGTEEKEDVLIIKLLTMGDAILITPMLPTIRERHPDARITLCTLEEYSDIFVGNPYIDNIKVVGPLDRNDFGPQWSLMAYDANIFNILTTSKWEHCYPCNQLDFWMEYRRAGVTMAQTYGDMFDIDLVDPRYQIYPGEDNYRKVDELIDSYPGDGPIVVFHTTAGWALKEWPLDKFTKLAEELWGKYKARIFVVGGPGERLESIYVRNVGGELSLREITALASRADLFVGGDSGPMHLSKAAREGHGCPMVVIYGCTNPKVVGYETIDNFIAIQSPWAGVVNCGFPPEMAPCTRKYEEGQGDNYPPCTARLSVEDVMAACTTILDREDDVQEWWKGNRKCEVSYSEWEWRSTLLEGEDPPDMCKYGEGI